jgi:hypothetical protein
MACKTLFSLAYSLQEVFLRINRYHRERNPKREEEDLTGKMDKKLLSMAARFKWEEIHSMTTKILTILLRTSLLTLMRGASHRARQMESLGQ